MNELPWLHPARVAALEDALSRRILVIDGAMGTMIQREGLEDADYRGERFAAHAHARDGVARAVDRYVNGTRSAHDHALPGNDAVDGGCACGDTRPTDGLCGGCGFAVTRPTYGWLV